MGYVSMSFCLSFFSVLCLKQAGVAVSTEFMCQFIDEQSLVLIHIVFCHCMFVSDKWV